MASLRRRFRSFLHGTVRPWWRRYQWVVLGVMLGGAFLAACVDAWAPDRWPPSIGYEALRTLGVVRVDIGAGGSAIVGSSTGSGSGPSPWRIAAGWLMAVVVLVTLLRAWAVVFRDHWTGLRLLLRSGHVIVCGLGDKGFFVASELHEKGRSVVVIERDPANPRLERCAAMGIVSIVGDASDAEILRRGRAVRASHVVALCGEDGTNAQIAARCREIVREPRTPALQCIVHIGDLELYALMRDDAFVRGGGGGLRLSYFNAYDAAAGAFLEQFPVDESSSHVVLLGFGRFGQSVLCRAARAWHERRPGPTLPYVTILGTADDEATLDRLTRRYPAIGRACSLNVQRFNLRDGDGHALRELLSRSECPVTDLFICFGDDAKGVTAGLLLAPELTAGKLSAVVRVDRDEGLSRLFRQRRDGGDALHFFAGLRAGCSWDHVVAGTNELIARAAHERYREKDRSKGGAAARPWDDLADRDKESNREYADAIVERLHQCGLRVVPLHDWDEAVFEFNADEVERQARFEHERWRAERTRQGWRYAPRMSREDKRTPYLVSWEELPVAAGGDAARETTLNMVRDAPGILARAGFKIVRGADV